MKFITLILCVYMHFGALAAQSPTSLINGTKDERHALYALINARIFVDKDTILDEASLLIQDNEIISVGHDISIPAHAIVRNLQGASIYPGFILMDSDYGLTKPDKKTPFSFFGKEIMDSTIEGVVNTNEAIKASYHAVEDFHHDAKTAKSLRSNGFSTVLSSKHDGIMRGTSALISLNDEIAQLSVVNSLQAFHMSFDKGSSKQLYPISLMGSSALLRQTWLDAIWYGDGKSDFTDLDLKAINETDDLLQIFEVSNWQQALLAKKIVKEFDKNIVIKTSGDSYKHIAEIKRLDSSLIVPLSFPKALNVSDELDAWNVSYEKMLEWKAAPYNLYFLNKHGIEFAIIPDKQKSFLKDLRKAIKKGLPTSAALAALTSTPARILNNSKLGHLNSGASANFIITNGDIFSKDGMIAENWVAGKRFVINELPQLASGYYQLILPDKTRQIELKNTAGKIKLKGKDKESKTKYKVKLNSEFVTVEVKDKDESIKLLGLIDNNSIHNIAGQHPEWKMARVSDSKKETIKDKLAKEDKSQVPLIPNPFSAYGIQQPSKAESFLISNTTVWTNEDEGILTGTDVLVKNGKIVKIGKNITSKVENTIDGTDMHLTAGIIDEHSHIALLSVNDIAVNSSMVRMEDALDSDSVNIYRNLAGGVTAAQLLHGSANPLGGQSALIKMRWGATSDELLIENSDPFIKFALGENVKRSRSQQSIRYPLTRMGVEQVYRDAFTNALSYEKEWNDYNNLSKRAKKKTSAPRRDLMLDATLQIINKERFVSCHSYVQSEINMLMKVADDFNFSINTFTHILEGYKVADKMLEHGAGASTFADWWTYKWEVNYAIPYNASIMTNVGVTTAINSDSAEMSRRLNQEAAKSMKYGNLTEEQALKLVTLNPAKLLHLDDRMGSIKVGKDADIVLWSNNPLSIYAKATKTFVDGKLLYDRDRQVEIENQIAEARNELIKALNQSDGPKMPASMEPSKQMHCDSLTGYEYLLGEVK